MIFVNDVLQKSCNPDITNPARTLAICGGRLRSAKIIRDMDAHLLAEPSPWVVRFAELLPVGGRILDLACGSGRHAQFLASLGYAVEAVDRAAAPLAGLQNISGIATRQADLEAAAWPYAGQRFAGIVVCNYLHRPLLPLLVEALDNGGVLIYETFMIGNERFGRPANPDFLLRPGELLEMVVPPLTVVAFEQGEVDQPKAAMVQRICATRGAVGRISRAVRTPL
jgi:SAM-dependent methyltransferase